MSGWLWVLLAGVFEIGFTTALKLQQHDTRYAVMFLVCAVLSFNFLSRALNTLPLSLAYAVWTGIGAMGTVVVGILLFGDPLNVVRLTLLTLLLAALIGLKLAAPKDDSQGQTGTGAPAD